MDGEEELEDENADQMELAEHILAEEGGCLYRIPPRKIFSYTQRAPSDGCITTCSAKSS